MKIFNYISLAVLSSCMMLVFSTVVFAQDFVIITNDRNDSVYDVSEIRALYLKEKTTWDNGIAAEPLGRPVITSEQMAFNAVILDMTRAELEAHWASKKSKTGSTRPREVRSLNILLRHIKRREGAFSIISREFADNLPEGIRVLFIND